MSQGSGETARADALAGFAPERFGFRPFGEYKESWIRETGAGEAIVVAPLAWQHAHAPSYLQRGGPGAEREEMDALKLLVELQRDVWGMRPEDLVPANLLGLLAETGGSVLAAYDRANGWNADGWLGFVIGVGARSGPLVSHMLGVREDIRGQRDIGWLLKIMQGYVAVQQGHDAMVWTFDPMRGMNAYLNLEKLGAGIQEFTVDKYGILRTGLYGDVPSDRLTARWDLTSPTVWARIGAVMDRSYRPPTLDEIAKIPEVTAETSAAFRKSGPPRLRYRIPGDIDRLARDDPAAAIRWRLDLRTVFTALTPTKSPRFAGPLSDGPAVVVYQAAGGPYAIDGFATGIGQSGERESFYLLSRTELDTTTGQPAETAHPS
jgi:chorismate synthase